MIKLPDNFKQYEEDEHREQYRKEESEGKDQTIGNGKEEEALVNESENSLTGLVLKLKLTSKIDVIILHNFPHKDSKVNFVNHEVRTVDILNRRFKVLSFFSEVDANEYLSKNPLYELLTKDEVCWNLAPSDYDGVEIEFIPYEFKKHQDGYIQTTSIEVKKHHTKVSWISEETEIKKNKRR